MEVMIYSSMNYFNKTQYANSISLKTYQSFKEICLENPDTLHINLSFLFEICIKLLHLSQNIIFPLSTRLDL